MLKSKEGNTPSYFLHVVANEEDLVLTHWMLPHKTRDLNQGNLKEVRGRDEANRFKEGEGPRPRLNGRE